MGETTERVNQLWEWAVVRNFLFSAPLALETCCARVLQKLDPILALAPVHILQGLGVDLKLTQAPKSCAHPQRIKMATPCSIELCNGSSVTLSTLAAIFMIQTWCSHNNASCLMRKRPVSKPGFVPLPLTDPWTSQAMACYS